MACVYMGKCIKAQWLASFWTCGCWGLGFGASSLYREYQFEQAKEQAFIDGKIFKHYEMYGYATGALSICSGFATMALGHAYGVVTYYGGQKKAFALAMLRYGGYCFLWGVFLENYCHRIYYRMEDPPNSESERRKEERRHVFD